MRFLLKYKFTLTGMIAGAIGGYLYYHFIGCGSGTCSITSQPLNSTLYGAAMGALILSGINNHQTETKDQNHE
ncbi:MAG: hypothetical protein KDD36_04010 [Flavobacteriales bacterium]|nr:hypothetical protein [Flavobacteriales bacterium]